MMMSSLECFGQHLHSKEAGKKRSIGRGNETQPAFFIAACENLLRDTNFAG
jgi:hypothetical protein